jgi:phosphotransferase system enzyme I (PtsI)
MPTKQPSSTKTIDSEQELRFGGIVASPGLARGPLVVGADVFEAPEPVFFSESEVEGELERLEDALRATKRQIECLQEAIAEQAGPESAAIFDAHLLMVEDADLLRKVRKRITEKFESSESAFYGVMLTYVEGLRRIADEYLSERTLDMEDVARRVVRNLTGHIAHPAEKQPHILLVHELTPSAAAGMDRTMVLGLITEAGSQTSHGAIIARSMGIPAVVGVHDISAHFHSGADCLVDGYMGYVILQPLPETLEAYEKTKKQKAALDKHLSALHDDPAETVDGRKVILSANIEFEEEMKQVAAVGAQGVGLYRTEFFYLNRKSLPSEEEQYANYRNVAVAAGDHGVIVRTLDVGADKLHDLHRHVHESNPFLGWRGIRVSLSEPMLFKTQLRAILRASVHGKLRIMFPMISGISEIRAARGVLEECRRELDAEGLPYDPKMEVGCMIEIPSAAVIADILAREVDFFSIGTNDLIQYTIAVDRGNDRVADLYQPCHPAIVRLMHSVSDAARRNKIWTGVCGEMAGDISLTPLMVGLGFEELSVAAVQLPQVKYAIRKLNAAACQTMLQRVLGMGDGEKIAEIVRETALAHYPELFV